MAEEQTQPQIEVTQEVEQPGAETPHVAEPTAETQPGAEQKPERTYSQREWSERESAKDKENAGLRGMLADQDMRQRIAEAASVEAKHQAEDKQAVGEGEITEATAEQRRQQRFAVGQREATFDRVAKEQQATARLQQQAGIKLEQEAKSVVARSLGKKYGADSSILEIASSAEDMERLAKQLQVQATPAVVETYDSGQMGSTGSSVEDMSPYEKIKYGLGQKQK